MVFLVNVNHFGNFSDLSLYTVHSRLLMFLLTPIHTKKVLIALGQYPHVVQRKKSRRFCLLVSALTLFKKRNIFY